MSHDRLIQHGPLYETRGRNIAQEVGRVFKITAATLLATTGFTALVLATGNKPSEYKQVVPTANPTPDTQIAPEPLEEISSLQPLDQMVASTFGNLDNPLVRSLYDLQYPKTGRGANIELERCSTNGKEEASAKVTTNILNMRRSLDNNPNSVVAVFPQGAHLRYRLRAVISGEVANNLSRAVIFPESGDKFFAVTLINRGVQYGKSDEGTVCIAYNQGGSKK